MPVFPDAQGHDIVFVMIDLLNNGLCGTDRNLMLPRPAAKNNSNSFFHILMKRDQIVLIYLDYVAIF